MTHGFGMSTIYLARLLPELSKHYRIVMFDNLGSGLNSRTDDVGDALESVDKAEQWIATWWDQLIDKLDLPPKFYLAGHSAGGAQSMMYASRCPERIEGLFLIDPAGAEDQSRQGYEYDQYSFRIDDNSEVIPYRCLVNKLIRARDNNEHPLSALKCIPYCLVKIAMRKQFNRMVPYQKEFFSDTFMEATVRYFCLTTQRLGRQALVLLKCTEWFALLKNHLFTKEKMLQDFDFPIAFVFGARDFLGSAEGADTIVRNNRHFQSGRSQIFKQKNSGHNPFLDNPDELSRTMIGFFEGTITGTFDLKTRNEYVKDTPPAK